MSMPVSLVKPSAQTGNVLIRCIQMASHRLVLAAGQAKVVRLNPDIMSATPREASARLIRVEVAGIREFRPMPKLFRQTSPTAPFPFIQNQDNLVAIVV